MAIDIRNLFNVELPAGLAAKTDAARKLGGKYQLNIAGAGQWTIDLVSNPPSSVEGVATDAQVTIDVAEADFQTVVADPNAGMKLYLAGKLKIKGNTMLAMNLQKLMSLR